MLNVIKTMTSRLPKYTLLILGATEAPCSISLCPVKRTIYLLGKPYHAESLNLEKLDNPACAAVMPGAGKMWSLESHHCEKKLGYICENSKDKIP